MSLVVGSINSHCFSSFSRSVQFSTVIGKESHLWQESVTKLVSIYLIQSQGGRWRQRQLSAIKNREKGLLAGVLTIHLGSNTDRWRWQGLFPPIFSDRQRNLRVAVPFVCVCSHFGIVSFYWDWIWKPMVVMFWGLWEVEDKDHATIWLSNSWIKSWNPFQKIKLFGFTNPQNGIIYKLRSLRLYNAVRNLCSGFFGSWSELILQDNRSWHGKGMLSFRSVATGVGQQVRQEKHQSHVDF